MRWAIALMVSGNKARTRGPSVLYFSFPCIELFCPCFGYQSLTSPTQIHLPDADLEKSISDLMEQAGIDARAPNEDDGKGAEA
jgi:hypothetical protein